MAYYSEIYGKFRTDHKRKFKAVFNKHKLKPKEFEDKYFYYFQFDWCKWYDSFKDVAAVNSLIVKILEKDELAGGYLKIGEDNAMEKVGDPDVVDLYSYVKVEGWKE